MTNTLMGTATSFTDVQARGEALGFDSPLRDPGEALRKAGLDFTIQTTSLGELLPDNPLAGRFHAAVRSTDGAILGINSERFHHHQPEVLGVLGEAIVKIRDDAYFSAGGQSSDQRTQFLVVTLNGEPIEGPNGLSNHCLLLANGTNGNRMLQVVAFDKVLGCANQFPAIFKGGAKLISLGHSWTAAQAIPTAIRTLQDATRIFDEMDLEIARLMDTPLPGSPIRLIEKVVGEKPSPTSDDKPGRLLTNWSTQVSRMEDEYCAAHNANAFGSAWGLVMAAQAVDEHGTRAKAGQKQQQRTQRILDNDYPRMQRALALVTG